MLKLTESTARMMPPSVISSTWKSRTSRSGCSACAAFMSGTLLLAAGTVAEAVAQQVDAHHHEDDHQAGQGNHPPGGGDVVLAVGDDAAPGGERPLRAGAEEAERAFQQHGLGQEEQYNQRGLLDDV